MILQTPRLNLLPLTRAAMTRRLESDRFELEYQLSDGPATVEFPPSWPGDALGMFRGQLDRLDDDLDEAAGHFTAILLETKVAIGQLGTKGAPNDVGEQEIGYGFNREIWGRGLATEAVGALTAFVLTLPGVAAVTAETAVDNLASARVLAKVGFTQTGTSWDADDGDLLTWRFVARD
ncbi:hypothetical protein AX769_12470 [Frondihabitans sp. PAMC 28766]|uniref:GNAT family N-acetyltransferase n=1 Tax=Frondihabitans sp. PAMC 28766 TaxID=1795630 RepID=UPI00078B4E8C|nr:GNAT family N-acetyltransferase [Frondihabitans sp. PAMC 28766]AMM20805.1 hypothetical protein AX769_12470 [Frondihabitans sp. PAMC 28766]